MEERFLVMSVHYIAAQEEDEVVIRENPVLDAVFGGIIEGDGKVTIGGGSTGDGVIWNGEED